ncbi:MAG: type II toxin-antitoxin system RelE/ParE family toxin [Sphingorhabdus sp.]
MNWKVEALDDAVMAEIEALPKDMRAKFEHISRMIMSFGLEKMREPYVKHIEGPLWEMRLMGRDGIARAFYVTATRKRVIVLRAFRKKTQKTPRSEIELALKRAQEVK